MGSLILKRLMWAIPVLWLVFTLTFFMLRAAPGGPFDQDRQLSPEVTALLNERYLLDEPVTAQYWHHLKAVLHGDLGFSYQYPDQTVVEMVATGLPVSAWLGLWALVVSVVLGVLIGAVSAWFQNRWPDHLLTLVTVLGISVPGFVVAPLLILLFAVSWQWLPVGGWSGGDWRHMLLPVVTLSLPYVAYVARMSRGAMLEVLNQNFVRTARAKGLSPWQILIRHVMRSAMLPVVNFLGPAAVGLITGSVVVEQIFGLPGLGRYFVQGALNRDYTLVLGVVLLIAVLMLIFNLLADLISRLLDSRVAQKS